MLPTFLGIGVNRAGTTWLHELLGSHPAVWMPTRRKEVRYFTNHFSKGRPWYERFFPRDREAARYRAVGEFSPNYFYQNPRCPDRIAQMPSIQKFILSLRNPVDRVYSMYAYLVKVNNYGGTFENYVGEHPAEVERGFYARHLKNYFRRFDREQFLILIHERSTGNAPRVKATLADFLGVDASRFPEAKGQRTINESYIPRFSATFAFAKRVGRRLRRRDLDAPVNMAKKAGLKRLLGGAPQEQAAPPPMKPETRVRLADRYRSDIRDLETLAGLDLSPWKKALYQ